MSQLNDSPKNVSYSYSMDTVTGRDLLPGDQALVEIYRNGVRVAGAVEWAIVADDTTTTVDGRPLRADAPYTILTSDFGNNKWLVGWRGPRKLWNGRRFWND